MRLVNKDEPKTKEDFFPVSEVHPEQVYLGFKRTENSELNLYSDQWTIVSQVVFICVWFLSNTLPRRITSELCLCWPDTWSSPTDPTAPPSITWPRWTPEVSAGHKRWPLQMSLNTTSVGLITFWKSNALLYLLLVVTCYTTLHYTFAALPVCPRRPRFEICFSDPDFVVRFKRIGVLFI